MQNKTKMIEKIPDAFASVSDVLIKEESNLNSIVCLPAGTDIPLKT